MIKLAMLQRAINIPIIHHGLRTKRLTTLYVLMEGRTCAYLNRVKLSKPFLPSFLRIQYEFQVNNFSGKVHRALEVNQGI